jgi:FecR protein
VSKPQEPPEVPPEQGDPGAEEEQVRRLLERAGPRPAVPPEDLAGIKAAFRTAWQEHVERGPAGSSLPPVGAAEVPRPARRGPWSDPRFWALAATLLLVAGLGWWWRTGGPAGPGAGAGSEVVARVESVSGVVEVLLPRGKQTSRLAVGQEIPAGAELRTVGGRGSLATERGRVALRLAAGPSLRLDFDSRVRLVSSSLIELERGAVYVDSGPGKEPGRVTVRTQLGDVEEIGTQFEVRLSGVSEVQVRVREGAVRLTGEGVSTVAAVERGETGGVELSFLSNGTLIRRPIAAHGPLWRWMMEAAPPFEIEGLTLRRFIERVARETGWTVRYADPGLAAEAETIVLHGALGRVPPDQAPEVVLPGAGLRHEVVGGTLVIRR